MRTRYLLPLRVPRLKVAVWIVGGCSPAKGNGKMTIEKVALLEQPPAPLVTLNYSPGRSRLQRLNTARRPTPLVPQSCQSIGHRRFTEKKVRGTSPGLTLTILRSAVRKSAGSTQKNRPRRMKRNVPSNRVRVFTPLLSAKDRIARENKHDPSSELVTLSPCSSVIFVTLRPHMTGGPAKNTAAALCDLAVGGNENSVILMYCCPQFDPGQVPSGMESPLEQVVPCCNRDLVSSRDE